MKLLDCVVVGAGVIGLSVARALANSGREVYVLEAGGRVMEGASSRNSGVIHAGLYYPPGSLKAQLCRRGMDLLYRYLESRNLPHKKTGKLIVASDLEQLDQLRQLQANAMQCGAKEVKWLENGELQQLEPALSGEAALLSPETGIIDGPAYGLSLLADVEAAGGVVLVHSMVHQLDMSAGIRFRVDDETFQCNTLINAAGLGAIKLLEDSRDFDPACLPRQYFAKGHYFSLSGSAPFSRLVYPMPSSGGLGIHFCLDMAGRGRFGPDICWRGDASVAFDPGRKVSFVNAIRRYWPQLDAERLQPDFAGVRSKIHGPDAAAADFMLQGEDDHGVAGLINLLGIESPGLTASLAIAEAVAEMLANTD